MHLLSIEIKAGRNNFFKFLFRLKCKVYAITEIDEIAGIAVKFLQCEGCVFPTSHYIH